MFNPLNLLSKFIKSSNQKELDRISKIVENVNSFENNIKKLSDDSIIGTGTVDANGNFSLILIEGSITTDNNNVYAQNLNKVSATFNIVLDSIPVLKFTSTGTSILTISAGSMADSILSISADLLDIPSGLVAPGITSDPSNVDTTTYGDKFVTYYGKDSYDNILTDPNNNANAVMTFRIVPDFVVPTVSSPALINTQTPTIVGSGTRDISFVILNDSDISLAVGTVANNGIVNAATPSLNEGSHSIRIRTIYLQQNGSEIINTSSPFTVTIDITSPVLNFGNGTSSLRVFNGEGATFNTNNTSLFTLPVDLAGGLTPNVASIDANTPGSYTGTYSGADNANNPLIDCLLMLQFFLHQQLLKID